MGSAEELYHAGYTLPPTDLSFLDTAVDLSPEVNEEQVKPPIIQAAQLANRVYLAEQRGTIR